MDGDAPAVVNATAGAQRSAAAGDAAIRAGSKSFALASRLFAPPVRTLVWDLYTWCRHCDDVVDGQRLGFGRDRTTDQRARLHDLRDGTMTAFAGQAEPGGPFAALQRVVTATQLPAAFTDAHLAGFAMDVDQRHYETLDDTLDYCHHVAGVVGLMMAWVMGVRDGPTLCRASDLGMGFQLTNIARDVGDDVAAGRLYLPGQWLAAAGVELRLRAPMGDAAASRVAPVVARLLDEAERYYQSARYGLPALPWRSAWAVATARHVYRDIGMEVRRRGRHAWRERVVTAASAKAARLLQAGVEAAWSRASRTAATPPRQGLYTPASVEMLG